MKLCGNEYVNDDGDFVVCTLPESHAWDPEWRHSDGDETWPNDTEESE